MYRLHNLNVRNGNRLGLLIEFLFALITLTFILSCSGGSDGDPAGGVSNLEEFPMDAGGGRR